jgi:hypothetical protein
MSSSSGIFHRAHSGITTNGRPGSATPTTGAVQKKMPRMPSHMIVDPGSLPKPWAAINARSPRARFSYYVVYAVVFIGAILGAVQCYFQYTGVALDRQPLCLVMEENFNDPAQVFGEPGGTGGTFMREANMDGFGFALIFLSIPRSHNNSSETDNLT